jgi:DNA-binding Xre family transcriptional regulator
MIKKMGIDWQLRRRMAERDMYATSDLVPLLAERGVHLSREQIYRLVTGAPQRLSMDVLAALCDILSCTPNDLISIRQVNQQSSKSVAGGAPFAASGSIPPIRRSTIRRPDDA